MTRRNILATGCATAGLAGLSLPSVAAAKEALSFGLTPVFLTNDLILLERLQSYLGRATGRAVRLVQRRTYQEITALLQSGRLDAAWICGYPFIRYRDQLRLLALPIWKGRPYYQSYLIVDAASSASGIEDLQGGIHAFSDPDSNSGYLVTAALLATRGMRPANFFAKTFFTYGHRNVVRAVSSGLAQSGSVDGYVWEVLRETEPDLTTGTRILRRSEWLGFPPIAGPATPRDAAGTARLAQALLDMADDENGREILSLLRLDGFERHGAGIFDTIAQKVEEVRNLG